jgi:hypothetical protein
LLPTAAARQPIACRATQRARVAQRPRPYALVRLLPTDRSRGRRHRRRRLRYSGRCAIGGSVQAATAASACDSTKATSHSTTEGWGHGAAAVSPVRRSPGGDRHGQWTYQFAVTVDDMQDGVDLVVRGWTCCRRPDGRSRWRLLGRPRPPAFDGTICYPGAIRRGLSKSNRDVGSPRSAWMACRRKRRFVARRRRGSLRE